MMKSFQVALVLVQELERGLEIPAREDQRFTVVPTACLLQATRILPHPRQRLSKKNPNPSKKNLILMTAQLQEMSLIKIMERFFLTVTPLLMATGTCREMLKKL